MTKFGLKKKTPLEPNPCMENYLHIEVTFLVIQNSHKFYQELLQEKSNPRLKGNRKGIIVKDKEFYIPILNTFPTR